jgi:hypothetical protein
MAEYSLLFLREDITRLFGLLKDMTDRIVQTNDTVNQRLSVLETQMSQVEAELSTLTTSVSDNAAAIVALATDVTNLQTSVATNTSSISTHATLITTNITNIATNVTNISTNSSAISTNTTAIATNASNVATNASAISANTTAISSNASDIVTNASDIASNASAVSTNATNIATNISDISQIEDYAVHTYAGTISSANWATQNFEISWSKFGSSLNLRNFNLFGCTIGAVSIGEPLASLNWPTTAVWANQLTGSLVASPTLIAGTSVSGILYGVWRDPVSGIWAGFSCSLLVAISGPTVTLHIVNEGPGVISSGACVYLGVGVGEGSLPFV